MKPFIFLFCLVLLLHSSSARAQFPAPSFSKNPFLLGVPVDLSIPMEPTVFHATDHKDHLAYELHISNFSKAALVLEQLEILDDTSDKPLADYTGKDLRKRLQHKSGQLGSRSLAGGMRAVVSVWLDFTKAAVPHNLRHRLRVVAPVRLQ